MDIYLLHPIINHFTIALVSISVLLDILGVITKKESLHTAAWINLIAGAIAGIGTVVTGLIAEDTVSHSEAAHQIMEKHQTIGYLILGIVVILFVWRLVLRGRYPAKAGFLYLLLGLVGTGMIFWNGFYGGEMVYNHGVAVNIEQATSEYAADGHHEHGGDHHESGDAHEHAQK